MIAIRPGMDVYDADQTGYIGTVVELVYGAVQGTIAGAGAVESGSAREVAEDNPHLVHEEGEAVSPTGYMPQQRLGEEMGPVPTIGLGNTGPVNQSAGHRYATDAEDGTRSVTHFAVRPGRINLGILTPAFWVPADAVRSLSMDRIVVSFGRDAIPEAWRRRP